MSRAEAGRVVAIHVAPAQGTPVEPREQVAAVAGRGLRGDRYFLAPDADGAGPAADADGDGGGVPPGADGDADADPPAAGTFADREGSDLTLIEAEALDAVQADYGIDLDPGVHRRNLTTRGVALNHLVGERFRVGEAVCEGVELCEPCSYLERHLEREGVREALVHRGGLRARIVADGAVRVDDPVERV